MILYLGIIRWHLKFPIKKLLNMEAAMLDFSNLASWTAYASPTNNR